jgi:hypothetical protein
MNTVDYFEKGPTEVREPEYYPLIPIRIEQISFRNSNLIGFFSFPKDYESKPSESTVAFFHVTPINIQP